MNTYSEIKNELTNHFVEILTPSIYLILKEKYDLAKKRAIEQKIDNQILMIFQESLKSIATENHDSEIIINTINFIKNKNIDYLDNLIKAVVKSNIQLILCSDTIDSKLLEKITTRRFIHQCFIECFKDAYNYPYLFLDLSEDSLIIKDNQRIMIENISHSIKRAIRKMLPFSDILKEYIGSKKFVNHIKSEPVFGTRFNSPSENETSNVILQPELSNTKRLRKVLNEWERPVYPKIIDKEILQPKYKSNVGYSPKPNVGYLPKTFKNVNDSLNTFTLGLKAKCALDLSNESKKTKIMNEKVTIQPNKKKLEPNNSKKNKLDQRLNTDQCLNKDQRPNIVDHSEEISFESFMKLLNRGESTSNNSMDDVTESELFEIDSLMKLLNYCKTSSNNSTGDKIELNLLELLDID